MPFRETACDTQLGTWSSSRWEPAPGDPLAGIVERVWDFEGRLAYRREQIFPNGTLELAIQLDTPHRPVDDPWGAPFPPVCISGLQTGARTIEAPSQRCRVVGVRFKPLGAFALLGWPAPDLTDRDVDLNDIAGRTAVHLAEALDARTSGRERVRSAVEWLRARRTRAVDIDPVVRAVLEKLDVHQGDGAIARLEELGGRSRSRVARRFREHVGVAPKRYARLVRFHRALRLLGTAMAGTGRDLSDVALVAGFYDQAHMNAEFREHAGLTPGRYLASQRFPHSDHLAHIPDSFFQEGDARTS
jgi:AraC-like DNA-binding protein